jgi:hypothetical protein
VLLGQSGAAGFRELAARRDRSGCTAETEAAKVTRRCFDGVPAGACRRVVGTAAVLGGDGGGVPLIVDETGIPEEGRQVCRSGSPVPRHGRGAE